QCDLRLRLDHEFANCQRMLQVLAWPDTDCLDLLAIAFRLGYSGGELRDFGERLAVRGGFEHAVGERIAPLGFDGDDPDRFQRNLFVENEREMIALAGVARRSEIGVRIAVECELTNLPRSGLQRRLNDGGDGWFLFCRRSVYIRDKQGAGNE